MPVPTSSSRIGCRICSGPSQAVEAKQSRSQNARLRSCPGTGDLRTPPARMRAWRCSRSPSCPPKPKHRRHEALLRYTLSTLNRILGQVIARIWHRDAQAPRFDASSRQHSIIQPCTTAPSHSSLRSCLHQRLPSPTFGRPANGSPMLPCVHFLWYGAAVSSRTEIGRRRCEG